MHVGARIVEKSCSPKSSAAADRIGDFVLHAGKPKELLAEFLASEKFGDHAEAGAALQELSLLFDYLEAMGTLVHVSFDLSLARGLDYYTGVIYEFVLVDGTEKVGSIAAGGRYDRLVGMFSTSGQETPCVGVSIGVERVFAIMEKRVAASMGSLQANEIQVYVASIGEKMIAHRMRVARILWDANISAEYSSHDSPKLKRQLDEVLERSIPFMLIFGEDEIAADMVKIKDISARTEEQVPIGTAVQALVAKGLVPLHADTALLDRLKCMNV